MRNIMTLVVILALAGVSACSNDDGELPLTFPTEITITHNGEPVEGATVTMVPQVPDGKGAAGITDEDGVARMNAFAAAGGKGVLPGRYKVTVQKVQSTAPAVDPDDRQAYEERMREMQRNPDAFAPEDLLPTKYKRAETSDLECTVSAQSDNRFAFDLRD